MSIIRDPDTYERFEKVVLVHGVRKVDELAYADLIAEQLPQHDYLGELVRDAAHLLPDGDARAVPQSRPHHRSHYVEEAV